MIQAHYKPKENININLIYIIRYQTDYSTSFTFIWGLLHNMQRNEDRNLYNAIVEGDQVAFTLFYNKHVDLLSCRVYGILKNKEHTEEVIQDVFCTLWNRRHEISSIQNVEGYWNCNSKSETF